MMHTVLLLSFLSTVWLSWQVRITSCNLSVWACPRAHVYLVFACAHNSVYACASVYVRACACACICVHVCVSARMCAAFCGHWMVTSPTVPAEEKGKESSKRWYWTREWAALTTVLMQRQTNGTEAREPMASRNEQTILAEIPFRNKFGVVSGNILSGDVKANALELAWDLRHSPR